MLDQDLTPHDDDPFALAFATVDELLGDEAMTISNAFFRAGEAMMAHRAPNRGELSVMMSMMKKEPREGPLYLFALQLTARYPRQYFEEAHVFALNLGRQLGVEASDSRQLAIGALNAISTMEQRLVALELAVGTACEPPQPLSTGAKVIPLRPRVTPNALVDDDAE